MNYGLSAVGGEAYYDTDNYVGKGAIEAFVTAATAVIGGESGEELDQMTSNFLI